MYRAILNLNSAQHLMNNHQNRAKWKHKATG